VAPDRSSLLGLPLLAGETLDDDARATLARTFGWEAVADAHRAPVVYRGRVLGAIWALSGDCGPHIGWHRREILQQVATSLAVELDKAFARSRLEDLNALSSRIAGKAGLQLARAMHPELQAWVRTYVHPEAEAAVVARTSAQVDLVSACPHTWTAEQVRALQSDSRRWGHRDVTIKPSDLTGLGEPFYGLAVPIALHEAATERVTRRRPTDAADRAAAGAEAMHGHLIVLSRAPLPMHHLLAMRDASRELAVVLDAERVRHALMAESGMFRHALLAPIQGLTDAALFLADLASEVDPDPELIVENRRRVNNEAERVRQWRVVQNLYGGGLISGEVRLHPRRQALYPMIETCMRRYDHTFQQRNISLLLERESARLHIVTTFDQEAMEIVVNNLLDNAAKYTFNNRTVTVGLEQDRAWARLWVRNFGHPLPEGMDIYGAGNRLPWEDRFRVIHGQGLGLYIVRTLVLAHGGRIEHSCRPMQSPNQGSWNGKAHDGAPARDETRPYIVQFTVSLPRDDAR
ncbi:MAG TPA: sensor histidine kinase, partial [Myxococcota bacterium]|nr:sensor histidine kinase [Myxococcota bacterium]